ncbi:MAG: NosD domain-containing protein [Gemmatimonas sp.]
MTITRSVRIVRKVYSIAANASTDSSVIVIRGNNITVDFDGAELRGSSPDADPDEALGVAIRIDGGRNVRVVNARVRGYRVGMLAIGTRGLTLTGNDVSYNWKPRLFSGIGHESLVDWMSFHHNEQREWLRFGAGIYLEKVVGGDIGANTAVQGFAGLMLTRSDSLRIHDNTFAFNSALGIGLYRSSENSIYRNTLDYNVRGFSNGFYRRGQDSAGLLMFEQSSHNVVAWNSVTHGGDGLFLWAGQTTMDTGEGGSNDNLFYQNDFSYAPTNGMEATFSRNDFIGNRIQGSDNGFWGGYSFNSRVVGNCFADNVYAIAIEHGQDITIADNMFNADSIGFRLWADSIAPSDWGYPKKRDTRSRGYVLRGNIMATRFNGVSIVNTAVADSGNVYGWPGGPPACQWQHLLTPEVVASVASRLPQADPRAIPSSSVSRMLRDAIVVDEWGPYDWRSPKLWPIDSVRLLVLGPPGAWLLSTQHGLASVSKRSGRVGDTIIVVRAASSGGMTKGDAWSMSLMYTGEATRSPRGVARAKGVAVPFSFGSGEDAAVVADGWRVAFHVWADSTDPRKAPTAFAQLLRGAPVLERREQRLDYMWSRPQIAGVPAAKFAAVATAHVIVPAGAHTLRTISDDAVRVWVDGKLVIDDWTPHESAVDNAPIAPGAHDLRVEYVQVDGWMELRVAIVKGTSRSVGTPGPH